MKCRAEADPGRQETGTRLFLVSVLVYLRWLSRTVRPGQRRPQVPRLQGPGGGPAGSAQLHKSLSPDTKRVPGGETIDTAACTVPRALPRRTCVSSRGQELELAPESVRSNRPEARTHTVRQLRNRALDTRTLRKRTTTPVGPGGPTNGGSRRVRGAAPARRFE